MITLFSKHGDRSGRMAKLINIFWVSKKVALYRWKKRFWDKKMK